MRKTPAVYNLITLFILTVLTMQSSFALTIHNFSSDEIKLKASSCYNRYKIDSQKHCTLTTTKRTTYQNQGTIHETATQDVKQKLWCPEYEFHDYVSINNILPQDNIFIADVEGRVPDELCLQIISAYNKKPINTKVNKNCVMRIYNNLSLSGFDEHYENNCF